MHTFFKTTWFLLRAQLRVPLFYAVCAAVLALTLALLGMRHSVLPEAALYDADGSALSRELVALAQQSDAMRLKQIEGGALDAALTQLRNGRLEAVFVIESGYGRKLAGGEYKDAMKLYISPYSTSAHTFSDILAADIMAQWTRQAAYAQAEHASPGAGEDAARLYAQGERPILLLQAQGDAALVGAPDSRAAHWAAYALSALSCLFILSLPSGSAAQRDALLERFQSRGQSVAGYLFARPAHWTLPSALAALPVAYRLAVQVGIGAGLAFYTGFLLYLVWLAGFAVTLDLLAPGPAARFSLIFALAAANATASYPSGLFIGAGAFRYLFGGYWLSLAPDNAQALLPLLGLALAVCLTGFALSKTTMRKR